MKDTVSKLLCSSGKKLCNIAVTLTGMTSACCRGNWYQPKEPEGFEEFLKAKNGR